MAEFHERLKKLRLAAGLKAYELGLAVGIPCYDNPKTTTCNVYSRYERGERQPKADTIKKLCEVLNCDANYLLGITDEPEKIKVEEKTVQDFSTDELLAELKRRWDSYGR